MPSGLFTCRNESIVFANPAENFQWDFFCQDLAGPHLVGKALSSQRRNFCLGVIQLAVNVAQPFWLPYRRFPIGWALKARSHFEFFGLCGLEIRDTAEWNSALQERLTAT